MMEISDLGESKVEDGLNREVAVMQLKGPPPPFNTKEEEEDEPGSEWRKGKSTSRFHCQITNISQTGLVLVNGEASRVDSG